MADKRFDDRLKRIADRTKHGHHAELLAGVGDVNTAKDEAENAATPKPSLLLVALGAVIGFVVFRMFRDLVGLEALMAMPPEMLMEIVQSEPMIGATAGFLALIVFLALISFFRGRRAVKMLSFAGGAVGAIMGGVYAAM